MSTDARCLKDPFKLAHFLCLELAAVFESGSLNEGCL